MWFMLACGCVGDPSLLLSTGTGGGQPVVWERVDYRPISPARFQVTEGEDDSDFTFIVADESFDVVAEVVYEDDFGVTLDVTSDGQTQRIRLAVAETSSIAFVYVLDDSQLVEEPNATPIALVYRNDEGFFITHDLLPDALYVMPKESTTTQIVGAQACAALFAAAPVIGIILVVGAIIFVLYAAGNACGSPSYDCTTRFRRWLNRCP